MTARVLPTRMNLLRQRRRLVVARRGHKLMKDKLEGLIRLFVEAVEAYGPLRASVDRALPATLGYFQLAAGASGTAAVDDALAECGVRFNVDVKVRHALSIPYPEVALGDFEFNAAYSALTTTTDFDLACERFRELFPKLLELASLEERILRMADEIERTRRRVNALEHVMIPGLRRTLRDINAKLEESERSTRARMMKVKDLMEAKKD